MLIAIINLVMARTAGSAWFTLFKRISILIHYTITVTAVSLIALTVYSASCGEIKTKDRQKWLNDIRIGILAHDVPMWSLTRKEEGADVNTEFIFNWPHYKLSGGAVRTNIGMSLNHQGGTSKVYSGVLWEYAGRSGIFLTLVSGCHSIMEH